jgi:Domain of Unknown Function (DUF1259)
MLGSVYRIGPPRTDLKVLLDGMELKPALALGSWLAFRSEGIRRWSWAIADEVTPVMRKLAGRDRDHYAPRRPRCICSFSGAAIQSSSPPLCTTAWR